MAEQTFQESIIDEFRANGGVVTRPYPDSTLVLVTLQGARSGRRMTLPLEYLELDGVVHVFATAGGAPRNPAWYHNLVANPEVTVEYGTETFTADVTELSVDDSQAKIQAQARLMPQFGEYVKTAAPRIIPAFTFTRA